MSYRDVVISQSPLAYWRLGDGAGPGVAEEIGFQPGTAIAGPTFGVAGALSGDSDTAITLNGTTQYVRLSTERILGGRLNLSIALWANLPAVAAASALYCERGNTNDILRLGVVPATGRLELTYRDDAGTFDDLTASSGSFIGNGWHFFVMTKAGQSIIFYADGAVIGSGVLTASSVFTNGGGILSLLGADGAGAGSQFLAGSLDEVALFPRTLTPLEIDRLYRVGIGTYAVNDYNTIAAAIAARFAAAALTAPAGQATIRSSTANAPGAIGPTPAVVVSIDQGHFETGNSTRKGEQLWFVRFYFDQTSDLERTEPALRKWLVVLRDQLKAAVQLAGLVDRAVVQSWKVGILAYGGVDYSGIEIVIHTATSEGWVATA